MKSLDINEKPVLIEPFVSIVTPVYNGEEFLDQCIQSVLAQDHANWEYIIVNNCSTDRTLEIANSYASKDKRIYIHCNTEFVNADANHNIAFRLISKHSKYCKVVSADDWLEPTCVSKLVAVAEANPSAGIVGSYQQSRDTIKWKGLPEDVNIMSGREVARRSLLREYNVFGTPTSTLYRADLIRARVPFYPHTQPHADTSVCYEVLQRCDLGFVHEVLSHERIHSEQASAEVSALGAWRPADIQMIQNYGPAFLDAGEMSTVEESVLSDYYRWLGKSALQLRGFRFWSYHFQCMRQLGLKISRARIAREAGIFLCSELIHPVGGVQKLFHLLKTPHQHKKTGGGQTQSGQQSGLR